MEIKQLEQLLEKYWQGESNLKEEQSLRESLKRPDLPEHLFAARDQLLFFEQIRNHSLEGNNMDERILSMIEESQTDASGIEEKTESNTGIVAMRLQPIIKTLLPLAAILLILLLSIPLLREFKPAPASMHANQPIAYDEQGAREAYQETQQALMLISEKLESGEKYLSLISGLNSKTETYFKIEDKK